VIILPAIDLKDNLCVRLTQGDFSNQKIYATNPLDIAYKFEEDGASYLHVIDLNGAQDENLVNLKTIQTFKEKLKTPFQVGGGIRSLEAAKRVLEAGASRIILGTVAIENKTLLQALIQLYGSQIVVSIDARKRKVAIKGWTKDTEVDVVELCKELESFGLETIVYTDIEKDGMLKGPNIEDYQLLVNSTKMKIIASGGITTYDDLVKLNEIGLYGAIVGKAIYENKIDLKEAIRCLQNVSSPV
jgi:phosphoribosylformimino-5-aminoimidazole carboxamide ribotide isomerase